MKERLKIRAATIWGNKNENILIFFISPKPSEHADTDQHESIFKCLGASRLVWRSRALGFDTRTLNPSPSIHCPKALKSCHSVCPSPSSTCDLRKAVVQLLELLLHPPRAAVSQDWTGHRSTKLGSLRLEGG